MAVPENEPFNGNTAVPIALTAARGLRLPKTCSRFTIPEFTDSDGETEKCGQRFVAP